MIILLYTLGKVKCNAEVLSNSIQGTTPPYFNLNLRPVFTYNTVLLFVRRYTILPLSMYSYHSIY